MQNDDDAHDNNPMPSAVVSTWLGAVHEAPLYVRALPPLSTAAQNVADGHDTA